MSNFNEFSNVITNTKSILREQKNEDFILFSIYEKNSHIFEKFVQDKFSHGHSQAMILAIKKIFITYKARSVQDIKNILNSDKLSKKAGSVEKIKKPNESTLIKSKIKLNDDGTFSWL